MSTRRVSSLFGEAVPAPVAPVAFASVPRAVPRRPDWALGAEEDRALEGTGPRDVELAEAHARGVEEGRAAVLAETAQLRARLEGSIAQIGAIRDSVMARSEDDLVDLALLIAESLVTGDPEARLRFTRGMASQALQLLDKAETIRLRVHPSERAGVDQAVQSAGADVARRVSIIDDISVGAGGVIAECELGRVDATFAEALRNIARGLKPGVTNLRLAGAEP